MAVIKHYVIKEYGDYLFRFPVSVASIVDYQTSIKNKRLLKQELQGYFKNYVLINEEIDKLLHTYANGISPYKRELMTALEEALKELNSKILTQLENREIFSDKDKTVDVECDKDESNRKIEFTAAVDEDTYKIKFSIFPLAQSFINYIESNVKPFDTLKANIFRKKLVVKETLIDDIKAYNEGVKEYYQLLLKFVNANKDVFYEWSRHFLQSIKELKEKIAKIPEEVPSINAEEAFIISAYLHELGHLIVNRYRFQTISKSVEERIATIVAHTILLRFFHLQEEVVFPYIPLLEDKEKQRFKTAGVILKFLLQYGIYFTVNPKLVLSQWQKMKEALKVYDIGSFFDVLYANSESEIQDFAVHGNTLIKSGNEAGNYLQFLYIAFDARLRTRMLKLAKENKGIAYGIAFYEKPLAYDTSFSSFETDTSTLINIISNVREVITYKEFASKFLSILKNLQDEHVESVIKQFLKLGGAKSKLTDEWKLTSLIRNQLYGTPLKKKRIPYKRLRMFVIVDTSHSMSIYQFHMMYALSAIINALIKLGLTVDMLIVSFSEHASVVVNERNIKPDKLLNLMIPFYSEGTYLKTVLELMARNAEVRKFYITADMLVIISDFNFNDMSTTLPYKKGLLITDASKLYLLHKFANNYALRRIINDSFVINLKDFRKHFLS